MNAQDIEIQELALKDAFLIKPKVSLDARGAFTKVYTEELLARKGIKPYFCEEYLTFSKKNVLRGMHYQSGEFAQAKLVKCIKGEIFDAIVDLRRSAPTFGRWEGIRLSEKNMLSVYVPRGFAHGFLALTDESAVLYKADNKYAPEKECGIAYNDSRIGIDWPKKTELVISEKDRKWPSFENCQKFE